MARMKQATKKTWKNLDKDVKPRAFIYKILAKKQKQQLQVHDNNKTGGIKQPKRFRPGKKK